MTQPLDSAVDRSRTAMEVGSEGGVELQSWLHNHNFNLLNDFTVGSNPKSQNNRESSAQEPNQNLRKSVGIADTTVTLQLKLLA